MQTETRLGIMEMKKLSTEELQYILDIAVRRNGAISLSGSAKDGDFADVDYWSSIELKSLETLFEAALLSGLDLYDLKSDDGHHCTFDDIRQGDLIIYEYTSRGQKVRVEGTARVFSDGSWLSRSDKNLEYSPLISPHLETDLLIRIPEKTISPDPDTSRVIRYTAEYEGKLNTIWAWNLSRETYMRIDGNSYAEHAEPGFFGNDWKTLIPITAHDYLKVAKDLDEEE